MSDFLMHYGIPGMKWGVRRTPEQLGHYKDPRALSQKMRGLKYKEFSTLKSPKETMKNGGSCHDQTFAELKMLRKMGKKPHGIFIMEVDDHGQGGMTHSLAYYQEGRNTVWFENAWEGRRGLHSMKSPRSIKMEIKKAHKSGEFGNKEKYKNLIFSDFHEKDHRVGEDLQEFVEVCLGMKKRG